MFTNRLGCNVSSKPWSTIVWPQTLAKIFIVSFRNSRKISFVIVASSSNSSSKHFASMTTCSCRFLSSIPVFVLYSTPCFKLVSTQKIFFKITWTSKWIMRKWRALKLFWFSLTCLQHHRNLLHLNFPEFAKFTMDSLVYQLISQINRTSVILQHFTRYPRSISAVLSYLTNDVLLDLHQDASQVYLESKRFLLDAALRSSNNVDLLMSFSPIFFDSITLLSSKDIRTIVWLFNDRLRRLITVWKNSPLEYKLMKTATSALIDSIDRLRGFLDDRLDFLLPRLEVYTPRMEINDTINQTYLLTWSKVQNWTWEFPITVYGLKRRFSLNWNTPQKAEIPSQLSVEHTQSLCFVFVRAERTEFWSSFDLLGLHFDIDCLYTDHLMIEFVVGQPLRSSMSGNVWFVSFIHLRLRSSAGHRHFSLS